MIAFGVVALVFSRGYPMGSAMRMGPGLLFVKLKVEPAPLILAFVLGPLMEENLRRALLISRGDPSAFLARPISAGFLITAALLLAIMVAPSVRRKRDQAVEEPAAA